MRAVRRDIGEFRHDLVVFGAPHSDDAGLGGGGLVAKLRRLRPDVRIVTLLILPGFDGVTDRFLVAHEMEAREALRQMLRPRANARSTDGQLLAALAQSQVVGPLEAFGSDREQQLRNVLKAAIRWEEGRREAATLGVEFAFAGCSKSYSDKRVASEDIVRLSALFGRLAAQSRKPLLITAHPEDKHRSHRLASDLQIRSLGGAPWDVWYHQTPWFDLPDPSVFVPLNTEELRIKLAAVEQHRSQTDRTPYSRLALATVWKNAAALPEMIAGFGSDSGSVGLGAYCEIFQVREFYGNSVCPDQITVFEEESATLDTATPEEVTLGARLLHAQVDQSSLRGARPLAGTTAR